MHDSDHKVSSPKSTSLSFPDEEDHPIEGLPFPAFDVEEVLASQTISFDFSNDISKFFDDVDNNEDADNTESKSTEKKYFVGNIETKKQKINKLQCTSQLHTEVESAQVNQRRRKMKKREDCSRRIKLLKVNKMYSGSVLDAPKSNQIYEKETTNTGGHMQIQESSVQNSLCRDKNVPKDLSHEDRILISKRNLQESYRVANSEKRRRKVKLIDFHELPYQQCYRRSLSKI